MELKVGTVYVRKDGAQVLFVSTTPDALGNLPGQLYLDGHWQYTVLSCQTVEGLTELLDPSSNYKVDQEIFVRERETDCWQRAHFSHREKGRIYVFLFGRTSWTTTETRSYQYGYAP